MVRSRPGIPSLRRRLTVAFDPYDMDEPPPTTRLCSRCGAKGLHWEQDEDQQGRPMWVLATAKGEIHKCPPATPNDFARS